MLRLLPPPPEIVLGLPLLESRFVPKRAFIAVNCAAFTETLLESAQIGHER